MNTTRMNFTRRLLVVALCALAAVLQTGCDDLLSDLGHGGRTGIDGQVVEVFAPGPIPDIDDTPYMRPMPDITVTLEDASGMVVARAVSDADGKFSMDIRPGTYTLRPQKLQDGPLHAEAVQITVRRGSVSNITVTYGGGIYQ